MISLKPPSPATYQMNERHMPKGHGALNVLFNRLEDPIQMQVKSFYFQTSE